MQHHLITDAIDTPISVTQNVRSLPCREAISSKALIQHQFDWLPKILESDIDRCFHEVNTTANEASILNDQKEACFAIQWWINIWYNHFPLCTWNYKWDYWRSWRDGENNRLIVVARPGCLSLSRKSHWSFDQEKQFDCLGCPDYFQCKIFPAVSLACRTQCVVSNARTIAMGKLSTKMELAAWQRSLFHSDPALLGISIKWVFLHLSKSIEHANPQRAISDIVLSYSGWSGFDSAEFSALFIELIIGCSHVENLQRLGSREVCRERTDRFSASGGRWLFCGHEITSEGCEGMTESPNSAATVSKQGIDAIDRDHSGAKGRAHQIIQGLGLGFLPGMVRIKVDEIGFIMQS